jgi:hypothetical protein
VFEWYEIHYESLVACGFLSQDDVKHLDKKFLDTLATTNRNLTAGRVNGKGDVLAQISDYFPPKFERNTRDANRYFGKLDTKEVSRLNAIVMRR